MVAALVVVVAGIVVFADEAGDPERAIPASTIPASTIPTTTSTSTTTTTTTLAPITAAPTQPPATVPIGSGSAAPVVSRVETSDRVVFFTIDDGYTRDPGVIEFLRDRNIPVTLFPVPGLVRQDPAYFEAIHALGASVQDHTVNHPTLRGLSYAAQRTEICGPLDDFAARFGRRPWLLRPPGGSYDVNTTLAARSCGIRAVVTWRATMNDGVLRTQGGPLRPGDIILMHFRPDLRTNLEVALAAAAAVGLHPGALEAYIPPA